MNYILYMSNSMDEWLEESDEWWILEDEKKGKIGKIEVF